MSEPNAAVLLVDDEAAMLRVYERILGRRFEVCAVNSAAAGLAMLAKREFAVIVSDIRMPEMDGVEFLSEARARAPTAVRMALTGHADLGSAMELVNRGNVYRFLTKPIETNDLVAAIEACVERHRLVNGERKVLESTLRNGVKMLTELLMVMNPKAFRRVRKVAVLTRGAAEFLHLPDPWHYELAATLQSIGPAFLPEETIRQINAGWAMPQSGSEVVTVALEFERRIARGLDKAQALEEMKRADFSPELIRGLESCLDEKPSTDVAV